MKSKKDTITIVLPGDEIIASSNAATTNQNVLLPGKGMVAIQEDVIPTSTITTTTSSIRYKATIAGQVRNSKQRQHIWHNTKKYNDYSYGGKQHTHDRVIGRIVERLGTSSDSGADLYRVDIRHAQYAILSNLEFQGATKRNKPTLAPGAVVYARVQEGGTNSSRGNNNNNFMELSCTVGPQDEGLAVKDWMTNNENAYGELVGGYLVDISTALAMELLQPNCFVLQELSKQKIAFEIAIGVNGRLWIHSSHPLFTILIANVIQESEQLTPRQVQETVRNLAFSIKKKIQMQEDLQE